MSAHLQKVGKSARWSPPWPCCGESCFAEGSQAFVNAAPKGKAAAPLGHRQPLVPAAALGFRGQGWMHRLSREEEVVARAHLFGDVERESDRDGGNDKDADCV